MEVPHSLLPITGNQLQHHQLQGAVANHRNQQPERKPRPQAEQALKCPRCASTNTKFCYYNNYSLSQPRYFCKGCRRYWTQGGSLRNVPVGGGCRKNKRSSSSSKISKSSLTSSSELNAINANKAASSFAAPLPLSIPPVCNNLALAFADNIFLLGHATANAATAANPSFLDILTSAAPASSTGQALSGIVPNNGGGLSNLYFGAEQEGPLMSFDGGVHDQRALEDRIREQPNSSWQGLLMNGSFMEGTKMDMPFSALGDAYSFF